MHDTAIDDAGYEWPTCVACQKDLWKDETERWACRPCEDIAAACIGKLPGLFHQLNKTAALMKGSQRVSSGGGGSRIAPIPVRLDVLDLVGPGGVATKLQAIEDSWRIALGRRIVQRTDGVRLFASWRTNPAVAVPEHAAFLGINLRKACEGYESVGQDVETIRLLHATCKALVDGEQRPGRVQIGNCPVRVGDDICWTPLTARADSHRVRCSACNSAWETIGEWRELRAAQEAVLAEMAGVAA